MKNGKNIISALVNKLHLYPLKKHKCYQKFISLLPPRFQGAIAFVYIENKTLFIALSHPGYKMELNYNKDLFKTILNTCAQSEFECQDYTASKVVFFNSKHHIPKVNKSDTVPYYYEMSDAKFTTDIQNSKLQEQFDTIKEIIKRNSKIQNEQ